MQRYTVDAGARLRFDTGPISHSSTLQVTRYRDELSRGIISGAPVLSNIYHPVERPKPSIAKPDAPKVSATELSGVAIADTLSILDQRVQVTVGLRKQNIQSHNYNAAGAVTTAYDAGKTTPLFGAVVKPWEHVSFYYNYLEGLSKGDVAPSNAANAGEIFAPYVSRQHEVGVKFDYGTFMSTLALFQIQKPTGELAQGRFSVQGEQRKRGLELSLFGEVAPGTRVLGGVTLAKHGAGLFQTYKFIVEEELASGSLVEVLQPYGGRSRPFTLLYPHGRYVPHRVRAFVDFLLGHRAEWAAL